MLEPKPTDRVESFATMHDAGAVMQAQYVEARDIDRQGQHWVSTVIQASDKSRSVYPQPVTMRVRPLGWLTLIEIAFCDATSFRFLHSRDGFEDQKAYVRGLEHVKRLTPDLKIKSAMELIRERQAAKEAARV